MAEDDFTPLDSDEAPAGDTPEGDTPAPEGDSPAPDPDAKFNSLKDTVDRLVGLAKPFLDDPNLVHELRARALQAPTPQYRDYAPRELSQADREAEAQRTYQAFIQNPTAYIDQKIQERTGAANDPIQRQLAGIAVEAFVQSKASSRNFKFVEPGFRALAPEVTKVLAGQGPEAQRAMLEMVWYSELGKQYDSRTPAVATARASNGSPNLGGGKGPTGGAAAKPFGNRDQAAIDHLKSMGFTDQEITDYVEEN